MRCSYFLSLDLPLVLGTELFQLLLIVQGQHLLLVCILGGLTPAFRLFQIEPPAHGSKH